MLKYEIIKGMKTLRESLLDDELVKKADEMIIKDEIESFLKENYDYINYMGAIKISNKPNKDGKYEVSSIIDVGVKNKNIISLTNGMFVWTVVNGCFGCYKCNSLISLKGAPEKVGGAFDCSDCNSLRSLKGAPEKVGGTFDCSECDSLISLEGAPKEVGGDFYCSDCEYLTSLEGAPKKVSRCFTCSGCNILTSLKGAPKEVGENFNCLYCRHLNSLKGAPKKVGGDFKCYGCAGKFTIEDVKKVSNVRGEIKC